ncbi:tRNA-pseudouridine synthase I, putative [Theileria annulata]|uniref:tRNA pseudouridine synthase n=1 Tax=Theileria annulata TaxID=5874 RepID=Q4UA31_THEAN|nr:tRNA-pseudouridine synthase I, putative [Theileria annulata]CAI76322.1 tRNA-pseudouridine synthase I, putative [Theileria annulata]|eukprot:XP_952946.1 tRNA-pseudouridine synthase I, putative [Theileria annulata]
MLKLHISYIFILPIIFVKYLFCLSITSPLSFIHPLCSNFPLNNLQNKSKFTVNNIATFINPTKPKIFESLAISPPESSSSSTIDTTMSDPDEFADDSTCLPKEKPKTNLILIVSYDGTFYHGMAGPMIFLKDYGIQVNFDNDKVNSINNELLKTITMLHGYFGNKRKLKKKNLRELSKKIKSKDEDSTYINGYNDEENTSSPDLLEEYARRFTLITSSRTDRGVHSMGTVSLINLVSEIYLFQACQYLSFDKKFNFDSLEEFQDSLNKRLPSDIRVTSVITPPHDEFNVRHHNIGKSYSYKVDLSPNPSLFERNHYWQIMSDTHFVNTLLRKYRDVKAPFSFEKLKEAARVFHGKHNFEAFRKNCRGNERDKIIDPICTIHSIEFVNIPQDKKVEIIVNGDRFLYKMVRCIVSHLILAGFNVIKPDQIKRALDNATEIPNIPYAPAHGLYLKKVFFEKEVQDKIDEFRNRYHERMHNVLN